MLSRRSCVALFNSPKSCAELNKQFVNGCNMRKSRMLQGGRRQQFNGERSPLIVVR
jgi:hypothetical protein